MFARQLNKSLVGPFSPRDKAANIDGGRWPCGPNAEIGISTKANVTWRGTALPEQHLDFFRTKGQQFRTNMFLATSFDKHVAEHFMQMVRCACPLKSTPPSSDPAVPPCLTAIFDESVGRPRALGVPVRREELLPCQLHWRRQRCPGREGVLGAPSQAPTNAARALPHCLRARRDQLTPYTVLTIKDFIPSTDLEVQPHHIIISVAPDNKGPPETLQLAPWG